jgi:nitrite reductase/ring-hydroxylating ferredoxin subunit
MGELLKICDLDDLKEGEMLKVEILGCDYIVIKLGEDVFVMDGACTHEWADLSKGTLDGDILTCPLHSGQFNIRTGEVVREPPTFPLQTYNAKIIGNEVWADVTGY